MKAYLYDNQPVSRTSSTTETSTARHPTRAQYHNTY